MLAEFFLPFPTRIQFRPTRQRVSISFLEVGLATHNQRDIAELDVRLCDWILMLPSYVQGIFVIFGHYPRLQGLYIQLVPYVI